LAGTALEEIGKATHIVAIYIAQLGGLDLEEENWVRFWWEWYSHESKTEGAAVFEGLLEQLVARWSDVPVPPDVNILAGEVTQMASDLMSTFDAGTGDWQRSRQAALYVDWRGKIEEPQQNINEEMARAMISRASEMVTAAGHMGHALEVMLGDPDMRSWLIDFIRALRSPAAAKLSVDLAE
jgi:AbiV family abortive infection protein